MIEVIYQHGYNPKQLLLVKSINIYVDLLFPCYQLITKENKIFDATDLYVNNGQFYASLPENF